MEFRFQWDIFHSLTILSDVQPQFYRTNVDVDMPRLPKRQGENELKQTADDVLKIWTIADEHKLYESFPRFVAEDLSRLPFVCADGTKDWLIDWIGV